MKKDDAIIDLGIRDKLPDDEGYSIYDPETGQWVSSDGERYKIQDEVIPDDIAVPS